MPTLTVDKEKSKEGKQVFEPVTAKVSHRDERQGNKGPWHLLGFEDIKGRWAAFHGAKEIAVGDTVRVSLSMAPKPEDPTDHYQNVESIEKAAPMPAPAPPPPGGGGGGGARRGPGPSMAEWQIGYSFNARRNGAIALESAASSATSLAAALLAEEHERAGEVVDLAVNWLRELHDYGGALITTGKFPSADQPGQKSTESGEVDDGGSIPAAEQAKRRKQPSRSRSSQKTEEPSPTPAENTKQVMGPDGQAEISEELPL